MLDLERCVASRLSRKLGDRSDADEAEWGMMGAWTETGDGEGPLDIVNQIFRCRET